MRQSKQMITKSRLCLFFLISFLFSVPMAAAQNKVVVVPLFDNQIDDGPPSPVPQTGQTTFYAIGDDGDLEMGVTPPSPRFTDNGDGTVTDNLTDLIWLKNANCPNGVKTWSAALTFANSLYDGWTGDGSGGDCGLSDGSSASDWRLSNIKELESLIDRGQDDPALPFGHPFTNVQSSGYWSSTTVADNTSNAWYQGVSSGDVYDGPKTYNGYVWPVRGEN